MDGRSDEDANDLRAPLEDTDVPKIIAYLMSVRGKSDK